MLCFLEEIKIIIVFPKRGIHFYLGNYTYSLERKQILYMLHDFGGFDNDNLLSNYLFIYPHSSTPRSTF